MPKCPSANPLRPVMAGPPVAEPSPNIRCATRRSIPTWWPPRSPRKGWWWLGPLKGTQKNSCLWGENHATWGKNTKKTGKGWEIPERAMEVLISFDGNIIYKIREFSSLPCLMKGITNHQPGRILFRVFPWDWVSLGESLVDHFWNITWPVRLWFRQSGHLRNVPRSCFPHTCDWSLPTTIGQSNMVCWCPS